MRSLEVKTVSINRISSFTLAALFYVIDAQMLGPKLQCYIYYSVMLSLITTCLYVTLLVFCPDFKVNEFSFSLFNFFELFLSTVTIKWCGQSNEYRVVFSLCNRASMSRLSHSLYGGLLIFNLTVCFSLRFLVWKYSLWALNSRETLVVLTSVCFPSLLSVLKVYLRAQISFRFWTGYMLCFGFI